LPFLIIIVKACHSPERKENPGALLLLGGKILDSKAFLLF